ncbi:MAG: hypothetical protein CO141_00550 [Candidatus Moranbacteria bacterium CG_4_9_14_3_um_filter_42_9]|nr:MAG: hypothetical protein CO141_00550 [Candidatus Moranbacteria bacterium CG_4_9_14_3_um_filter_42_9]
MGKNRNLGILKVIGKTVIAVVVVFAMGFNVYSLVGVYYDQKNSVRQSQKQEQTPLKKIIRNSENFVWEGK